MPFRMFFPSATLVQDNQDLRPFSPYLSLLLLILSPEFAPSLVSLSLSIYFHLSFSSNPLTWLIFDKREYLE